MNPKPIKKMLLGITCTWKGFYTVSQVILTSVVVRTQFSINILSSYNYTKKKPLNKDKTTTKNNNNNKINCNIINTLQHTIIDLE